MPRRVLITGGRGFAGRHVIEQLLMMTDWEIVSIDGRKGNRLQSSRVMRVTHDLRYPMPAILDVHIGEIDAVLHLAARADVHRFLSEPLNPILNNVHSILHMLEWARMRGNLSHFILCSTNEIYGPSGGDCGSVEWSPVIPPTTYSASKAAQEAFAISYWRTYGLPLVITNTMQLFGHDQPDERFIPTVVRNLLKGEPIKLFGSGNKSPRRCWTYVDNYADSLRWLLGRPPDMWPNYGRPSRWNIAGPALSCEALIFKIAGILEVEDYTVEDVDSELVRPGHELRYALDTHKIEYAGWRAPFHFDEALESTVKRIAERLAR